jgi:hypothetical protein
MAYTFNYTEPEKPGLSDMEELSINQDKIVETTLKNGKSFSINLLDRWSTYTAQQQAAFKFILNDLMQNSEDEDGNKPSSVEGDL